MHNIISNQNINFIRWTNMIRTFLFLLGFGFTVIGFMYIVAYLNLLTMGYTFMEYLMFIFKRLECLLGLVGLIIVTVTIFCKGDNDNAIHI